MAENTQFEDIGSWASGTIPSEGELVLSPAEIEEIVDDAFATLGNLVTDIGDIPATASPRARGAFTLPDDMRLYLEDGGLITYDSSGAHGAVPIVYILKQPGEGTNLTIYTVYIDDES